MREDSSITVNYANLTYAFMKFQEQYKNVCQKISEEKRKNIYQSLKKVNSFFFEYKTYVKSKELRDYFDKYLLSLKNELYNDTQFSKLCSIVNKNSTEGIIFNQKYYYYVIKILKVVGVFGDELSRTFMPNKTDREKLFKYWNNNSFFEQFTYYKSNTADIIANFNIHEFKQSFSYILGFYFAYYLFIDERSRYLCENVFSNILNIILNKNVLNLIIIDKKLLGNEKRELLKNIDYDIHNGLNNIFFRCNYSYSLYGIMPRMETKVLIDKTTI